MSVYVIDAYIVAAAQEAFDDNITNFGKDCKLIYTPTYSSCVNCIFDPIGKKSSNSWKSGGPIPFGMGQICPLCGGSGQRATENYDVIRMTCSWNPKEFSFFVNSSIRTADGHVLTRGYITDLPKIKRCTDMILQSPQSGYINWRYQLDSEPIDPFNIVKGRYFVALWKRVG